jgi:MATE family, multidrug efflux pump
LSGTAALRYPGPTTSLARDIRATAALAVPLIAGQLSVMGMGMAEVILAGHLSAHVLGTVAIGAALFNIANLAAAGVNAALAPSVAQLDGARRRDLAGPLFRQALAIAAAVGLALATAVYFAAPRAAGLFGFAPALTADVGGYLRAAAPAAFSLSLFYCCRGFSEGLSQPRPTFAFALLGLVVLVPVGYALMYGAAGLPALGARGAGLATTTATAV